jgi:hypothetical protein
MGRAGNWDEEEKKYTGRRNFGRNTSENMVKIA